MYQTLPLSPSSYLLKRKSVLTAFHMYHPPLFNPSQLGCTSTCLRIIKESQVKPNSSSFPAPPPPWGVMEEGWYSLTFPSLHDTTLLPPHSSKRPLFDAHNLFFLFSPLTQMSSEEPTLSLCLFLLHYWSFLRHKWVSEVAQSCPTLWTVAHQAPLSMGFFRQEYWSGLPSPSPGDLPDQGSNSGLPHCGQTF